MDIPTIHARRLDLRPLREGDAAFLAPMMADPETVRYFPFKSPPNADQVGHLVNRQARHWNVYGHGWWAVELHEGRQFAGWCGLQYLPETDEIEIGYLLAKPHWGKGLATEAAAHALSYAFGPLGLDAVVGIVHAGNAGSRRVLEKVGGASPTPACYFGMECLRYILTAKSFQNAAAALGGAAPLASLSGEHGLKTETARRNGPPDDCDDPNPATTSNDLDAERRVGSLAADAKCGAAIGAARESAELLRGRHIAALYRMARMTALTGRREETYGCLDHAVRAGFWDAGRLQDDAAFAHLRQEDAFRPVLRGAWANGYILMLEREEREAFQKPNQVMEALAFRPGERVAEIGPGSGYFTVRVARAVGPEGKIYALDASQEMLDHLRRRTEIEGLSNVQLAKIPRDDPGLPEGGVDTVLMVDVLHYVSDKPAYARKLALGIGSGGRAIVVDYRPKPFEERPWGPPPEQQVPQEEIDAAMSAAGFEVAESHDFLPEQYLVVYRLL